VFAVPRSAVGRCLERRALLATHYQTGDRFLF